MPIAQTIKLWRSVNPKFQVMKAETCKKVRSVDIEIEPLNQRQLWGVVEHVKMNVIEHATNEEMGSKIFIFT